MLYPLELTVGETYPTFVRIQSRNRSVKQHGRYAYADGPADVASKVLKELNST
jgi:hypothetical protein